MAPSSRQPTPGSARDVYQLGEATITVALDAGPRILGYGLSGYSDLFADLPDAVIEHQAIGWYWFIGGHRLWRAPENPSVTYQPDDQPVQAVHDGVTLTLTGSPDSDGIVKILTLTQDGSRTVVDHVLHNAGTQPVETAPWAISQLVPGGRAILPAPSERVDGDDLLPNRSIVLWPYSDVSDAGVSIDRHEIRIDMSRVSSKFKIGQPNRRGWIAYGVGSEIFVKWSPRHDDTLDYADLGSSVQCYGDSRFVELESLGPLTSLEPGELCRHREVWTMVRAEGEEEALLASLPPVP